MFWNKKNPIRTSLTEKKTHLPLSKSSIRVFADRSKRMEICWPCYLFVEAIGYFVPATTLNISKSGMQVRSMQPMETGQEVLCLITNKKRVAKYEVLEDKNTMKGKIVRVEKDGILFRIAIQIALGPVNPMTFLGFTDLTRWWCDRYWQ